MGNNLRRRQTSRDSLYFEMAENLERLYDLWREEEGNLRFSLPILCAVKLKAFINAAGKLKVSHWDILERKLQFREKCLIVFSSVGLTFDSNIEPNKTALDTFEIRNSLIHPKMKRDEIDEEVSQEKYDQMRRSGEFGGVRHHLRSELTKERVSQLKDVSDQFVSKWGPRLIGKYWQHELTAGSHGEIT